MEIRPGDIPSSSPDSNREEEKEGVWKNIITIIFLILVLPIGLILMWLLATWSKRTKIILTLVLLIPIIAIAALFFLLFSKGYYDADRARDSRIVASIGSARTVMVVVRADEQNYDNFNCTRPDIVSVCREIENNGGEVTIAKDRQINSQAACMYSPLNAKSNYWYCIDSQLKAGFTTIDPGSLRYCVDGKTAVCPPVTD